MAVRWLAYPGGTRPKQAFCGTSSYHVTSNHYLKAVGSGTVLLLGYSPCRARISLLASLVRLCWKTREPPSVPHRSMQNVGGTQSHPCCMWCYASNLVLTLVVGRWSCRAPGQISQRSQDKKCGVHVLTTFPDFVPMYARSQLCKLTSIFHRHITSPLPMFFQRPQYNIEEYSKHRSVRITKQWCSYVHSRNVWSII